MPRKQNIPRHCKPMTKQKIAAFFIVALFLIACGDSISGSNEDNSKTISGVTQKGPFLNGSSVTILELDGETLAQTGGRFEGKIKSDLGDFSIKVKKIESQYALLKANGFYRNEVTGEKSKSQITLYALTDLSNRDEVNVNLLTHLAHERTLYLATEEGLSVTEAKKQAESEVLKSFGIEGDFAAAEDLNIFGESDQNAALLAISILMQGELSEGDFSERLADYAADIETDGIWNDSITATKIADWAYTLWIDSDYTNIRKNISSWGFSQTIPIFEIYITNFWQRNYGLGTCNSENDRKILKNQNEASSRLDEYFACNFNSWRAASSIEKDTLGWSDSTDGAIKKGNVTETTYIFDKKTWKKANDIEKVLGGCVSPIADSVGLSGQTYYICKSNKWEVASAIEYDTYKWENGKDGDIKYGSINTKNCYVFEDNTWRTGNETDCGLDLRGCTTLRQDTVALGSDSSWHICDNKKWREASDIEKDTAAWGAGAFDGEIRNGQINTNFYYIYKKNKLRWQNATDLECDTYLTKCSKDGSVINGKKSSLKKYVCDADTFRLATEDEIRADLGCTSYTHDEFRILKGQYSYYKCTNNGWTFSTEKTNEGKFTDKRDGKEYRTIGIRNQMWMAENLKYNDSTNHKGKTWCYNNEQENCEKYGILYEHSYKNSDLCPEGWHTPKICEMITLNQNTEQDSIYNFFANDKGFFVQNTPESCQYNYLHLTKDGNFSWAPVKEGDLEECSFDEGFFKPETYYWISKSDINNTKKCDVDDVLYTSDYWDATNKVPDYTFSASLFTYGIYIRCVKDEE